MSQQEAVAEIKRECDRLGWKLYQFGSGLNEADLDLIVFLSDISDKSKLNLTIPFVLVPILDLRGNCIGFNYRCKHQMLDFVLAKEGCDSCYFDSTFTARAISYTDPNHLKILIPGFTRLDLEGVNDFLRGLGYFTHPDPSFLSGFFMRWSRLAVIREGNISRPLVSLTWRDVDSLKEDVKVFNKKGAKEVERIWSNFCANHLSGNQSSLKLCQNWIVQEMSKSYVVSDFLSRYSLILDQLHNLESSYARQWLVSHLLEDVRAMNQAYGGIDLPQGKDCFEILKSVCRVSAEQWQSKSVDPSIDSLVLNFSHYPDKGHSVDTQFHFVNGNRSRTKKVTRNFPKTAPSSPKLVANPTDSMTEPIKLARPQQNLNRTDLIDIVLFIVFCLGTYQIGYGIFLMVYPTKT
jgi:hypothetical protein